MHANDFYEADTIISATLEPAGDDSVLAYNDDRSFDLCSLIELDIGPGETVYAHVLEL